jgi:phage baseplate assembly protein W
MLPEYGGSFPELLFNPNIPSVHQAAINYAIYAINDYDPRITVKNMSIVIDPKDDHAVKITIDWVIKTQSHLAGTLEYLQKEEY